MIELTTIDHSTEGPLVLHANLPQVPDSYPHEMTVECANCTLTNFIEGLPGIVITNFTLDFEYIPKYGWSYWYQTEDRLPWEKFTGLTFTLQEMNQWREQQS